MKKTSLFTIVLVALALASLFFLFGSLVPNGKQLQTGSNGETLRLSAPAFLQASNVSAEADIAAKLDTEAGISAYFKSSSPIDVTDNPTLDGAFTVIETKTADYLIGSVGIPGYNSHFDAHVYVHKDGWIMAYYLRSNPLSKIVDSRAKTINNTLLKTAVANVASAAGAAFTDVSYYDFRYPNSTHILLVAEDYANGNTFTINLPSTYTYYERGWSAFNSFNGGGGISYSFYLNDVNLSSTPFWTGSSGSGDYYSYGAITQAQLLPNTTHTIKTSNGYSAYAVLIVIYKVP
jgi:hypothetical protein